MSTANTPKEPPMTTSDPMEEYEETVEWIVDLGVDRAAAEMSLAWAKPRIPIPGDHDELLARTATHRSDGVGGGVALIRELETALRAEQSARQAAEAERDALREVVVAAPGYMSQDRAEQFHQDRGVPNPYRWQRESRYYDGRLVVALSERDALQARIDTALAVKPNPYGGNTGEIGMRAALTESKGPDPKPVCTCYLSGASGARSDCQKHGIEVPHE